MDGDCVTFASDCQVRAATDLVGHTWDPVLLVALRRAALRRRDLRRTVGGISDKALTESLTRLVARGLVVRGAESTSRHVVYTLSPLGRSFAEGPLAVLAGWAQEHAADLDAAAEAAS